MGPWDPWVFAGRVSQPSWNHQHLRSPSLRFFAPRSQPRHQMQRHHACVSLQWLRLAEGAAHALKVGLSSTRAVNTRGALAGWHAHAARRWDNTNLGRQFERGPRYFVEHQHLAIEQKQRCTWDITHVRTKLGILRRDEIVLVVGAPWWVRHKRSRDRRGAQQPTTSRPTRTNK